MRELLQSEAIKSKWTSSKWFIFYMIGILIVFLALLTYQKLNFKSEKDLKRADFKEVEVVQLNDNSFINQNHSKEDLLSEASNDLNVFEEDHNQICKFKEFDMSDENCSTDELLYFDNDDFEEQFFQNKIRQTNL